MNGILFTLVILINCIDFPITTAETTNISNARFDTSPYSIIAQTRYNEVKAMVTHTPSPTCVESLHANTNAHAHTPNIMPGDVNANVACCSLAYIFNVMLVCFPTLKQSLH